MRDTVLSNIMYKRASLACAERLRCVRRVTQSNLFWEFFPVYKYCKQKLTNNFSNGSENIIFEIYTPENPMSTVQSF